MSDPWGPLVDLLAERVAERVLTKLRGDAELVDQAASPLGPRRHCRVVRERLARGEPGAAVVGRRHLLSREALDAELGRPRKRLTGPLDDLDEELGLEPA